MICVCDIMQITSDIGAPYPFFGPFHLKSLYFAVSSLQLKDHAVCGRRPQRKACVPTVIHRAQIIAFIIKFFIETFGLHDI